MEVIRHIEKVEGDMLTVAIPPAFRHRTLEIIVMPIDSQGHIRMTQGKRKPPHELAGKVKVEGDIIGPIIPEEYWGLPQ